jgi:hypothetical protein
MKYHKTRLPITEIINLLDNTLYLGLDYDEIDDNLKERIKNILSSGKNIEGMDGKNDVPYNVMTSYLQQNNS